MMSSLALPTACSLSSITNSKPYLTLQAPNFISPLNIKTPLQHRSGGLTYQMKKSRGGGGGGMGAVCYSSPLSPYTLQWVTTISSAVLVLAKGTAITKAFLVPLFVLQAPTSIMSWIRGEYGTWTAFLALLVRLFFYIPGELELPFMAMLFVLVSPYQVTNVRGTQGGAIASLIIAGYLAFQHFSRQGSLQKAFDRGSAIASLAIVSITAASCFLLV